MTRSKTKNVKDPIVRKPNLGLPNAPVRPAFAVATERERFQSHTTDYARLCLKNVRSAYQLPAVEPRAIDAWNHAKRKHKWTGDVADIPYGAPVFSQRPGAPASDAGHVFMCGGWDKNGQRIFWTNDIIVLGGINPVHIEAFTERWGHKILGWTEDLNGYDLNLPKSPNERKRKR